MAGVNLPEFKSMNATGIGEQDRGADEGGRGVFDQVRPAMIVATGKRPNNMRTLSSDSAVGRGSSSR